MARAFLLLLDSFGIGGAPDAADYGDLGSDTLGHIAEYCAAGLGDRTGLRKGPLSVPHMVSLGLVESARMASGSRPAGIEEPARQRGLFGAATEISRGKDTPSGHWEIAGQPVQFEWGYFPDEGDAFDEELVASFIEQGGIPGILGNCHASGTVIIKEFGAAHMKSGKPIFYTSSDSVVQIAAHEESFGLEQLYELCWTVRKIVDPLNIGRVIARPFLGSVENGFKRTGNRRDFSVPPPGPTLLDVASAHEREVIAIGKISDIYAHHGVTDMRKANGNEALFNETLTAMDDAEDGDLVFTNFVDFDMLYGHRRDVPGYAAALEAFDRGLPQIAKKMKPGDLALITADHGCDPTWRGTDHTRERVPILGFGPGIKGHSVGVRDSFADIGASLARHLSLPALAHGRSFL
ncbi:phosphopentomutase [Pseudohoeflea coraliihabitans]|uniref:Phosphopentomutase n=1 Tax=Pseudohoeflea coraliihabitans TaxID=2860393 RepID=A0ABS6WPA3_9HYPH|nr:phosphopentomutase [Pseudohoeflea sp. DP4N28-3]MBW3097792.1 phosphopentomutase [Pseudohoeflea sp. DP4N28-3]